MTMYWASQIVLVGGSFVLGVIVGMVVGWGVDGNAK
jgi:hypothetical protein